MTTPVQFNHAEALAEYGDDKRLAVYKMLTSACTHLFSKGKLQREKFDAAAAIFADISRNDPLFMVHLAAYVSDKSSNDMRALTVFFNALNDADGLPFYPGSAKNKPNLRVISHALLQNMEPKLTLRVLQLCHLRFGVAGLLNMAKHFPKPFQKAFTKYIHYREQNPDMLRGIRKAGLRRKMEQIYRLSHTAPSDEAVTILGWAQKDGRKPDKSEALPDFGKMTSEEIADTLTRTRIAPMVSLSVIPANKITASVAKQLLNSCTGNQAIILYRWFARNGFLDVPAIKELFGEKVQAATTAVDRIETLTADAAEEDRKDMINARSVRRKKQAGTDDLGKLWMHIDASGSMGPVIEFAKDRGSIFAECVNNPEKNFRWGLFGSKGIVLDLPGQFTKDDFHAALYGVSANMGSTDCIALYPQAREFGAEVDIYVTDQGHNVGGAAQQAVRVIAKRINDYHQRFPNVPMPKAAVIVDFGSHRRGAMRGELEDGLKSVGIPVAIITPEALKESALVAQSVRTAIAGEIAVVNEIMDTKLPSLPKWWFEISS